MYYISNMRKTYEYRIYPSKAQVSKMNTILEECRWVYNQTLELRKTMWESDKRTISLYDTNKKLTEWKFDRKTLNSAQSQVLQNAQLRVDLAFKSFFRRCKTGENPGYPRFKGYGRYDSFTYPQSGFKLHTDDTFYLSKVGRVKIVSHRPFEGVIKTCTVKRTSTNKWYIALSCDIGETSPLPKTGKVTGIDLGLITYIQCSDGSKIDKPRFFKDSQKTLSKIQRRYSKSKTQRNKHSVALVHEKVKNRREDFCHKASKSLVEKYDFISHEDLDVQNMLEQKRYSKSISDAAWNTLIQFLSYKAESADKIIVAVDPRGTSQRCSQCGCNVPKKISDRNHNCPHCGFKSSRDLNSAIEILRLGLKSLGCNKP